MAAKKPKKVAQERDIKVLAKGIDSLYLYLDCGKLIGWEMIMHQVTRYGYDESFKLMGLSFIRIKAWMKTFPVCMKHGQFMFFLNRSQAYIKVLSLAFELKGFLDTILYLCNVLDQLTLVKEQGKWLDYLKVSRIDVFMDFAYHGDFNLNQFKTRLRKKGLFKSGENSEAITYYFGSRDALLVRLYVKSEEIKHSGKDYLKSHWKKFDCQDARVWRLEFEYHKDKILEVARFRELSCIDPNAINKLFAYGVDCLQYMNGIADSRNLHKKDLHPLWQMLKTEFNMEYQISKKAVRKANINYRFKRARKCVISWLVAQGLDYDEVERFYIEKFRIDRFDYERALKKQQGD